MTNPTGSWSINNKTVQSLQIGNKEIETIERVSDGAIIYQRTPTHIYALTVQLSTNSIYDDESTVISGVLTDNGSVMSGETITIYDGNTSLGTCTTDSNGAYSKTLSGFSVGTHTLKASYTDVDSSTVSLSVQTSAIILTAPNLTLTYKDGTQTQITVMKKGQPYGVGENVVLTINGSNYDVAIGSNGYANRDVNLSVGTYTATVTYGSVSTTCTYVISKAPSTTTLNVSSTSISTSDTLTVSGKVTSPSVGNASVKIYDGATLVTTVTSSSGTYSTTLTGLSVGTHTLKAVYSGNSNHNGSESSTVTVTVTSTSIIITFTGTSFTPYDNTSNKGVTGSNMSIDWGDGTTESLTSSTKLPTHTYSKNGTYTIEISGANTIGAYCFRGITGLTNIVIPSNIRTLSQYSFYSCTGLTSITIPNTVTTIGMRLFNLCSNLIDYQFYWDDPPVTWASNLMPNHTNTYYTIPHGTTANYVAKSFPSAKLIERNP